MCMLVLAIGWLTFKLSVRLGHPSTQKADLLNRPQTDAFTSFYIPLVIVFLTMLFLAVIRSREQSSSSCILAVFMYSNCVLEHTVLACSVQSSHKVARETPFLRFLLFISLVVVSALAVPNVVWPPCFENSEKCLPTSYPIQPAAA